MEDQSGEFLAAEAGQRLPAAERDATPGNPSLPERPLRGFAEGGIRRCNDSFVVVGDQTVEKLAGSTVRFGLARAFYPARVPFAVHGVSFKSIFLFAFYNIISGGLPWSVALAMDETKQPWLAWSLLPWLVLIAGAIALWRKPLKADLICVYSGRKIAGPKSVPSGLRKNLPWQELVEHSPAR